MEADAPQTRATETPPDQSGSPQRQRAVGRRPEAAALSEESRVKLKQRLRSPLNTISGFAELLALQAEGGCQEDSVQRIRNAAGELLEIINRELGDKSETTEMVGERASSMPTEPCDILYIEDDEVNFTLISRILDVRPALHLRHATQGLTGLEMARANHPRLILLDLNLPDMHGSEVLHRLQQEKATAKIPVVILSADATPSQIERLLSGGARNYLTKPFRINNFLAVVDEVLEQYSESATSSRIDHKWQSQG